MIYIRGDRESTLATINERKHRIFNSINETVAIIEDSRVNKLGSMKCAVSIWELAIIPALLNNSSVWTICDKTVQMELEKIQTYFFKRLLQVPNSCPRPSYAYEANILRMKYRMYCRLLNFMKHVHSHSEQNLSKQVLLEQLENDWPGLSQVAVKVMTELGITGLFDTEVSKSSFKRTVKKACRLSNDESLRSEI